MGNFFTNLYRALVKPEPTEQQPAQKQVFSWEREDRKVLNKEDFILDKLKDQTIYRLPGSVNGQQFIIQNCDNCKVYVFDHTAQIQIDDCTNCQIFIGPVNGSIFIRDSTNCVLATVCKQFRTRDCRELYVYLSCESQPIIEASHNIKFGCLTLNYDKLADQYKSAGISPWNNNWGNIHDFTTIPDGKNYSLLEKNDNVFKHLPIPTDPSVGSLHITDSPETSNTPYTYGEFYRIRNEERCLVVFFHDANADLCARELLKSIGQTEVLLVQTKCYTIDETSAERLFGNNRSYNTLVTKGPVIGLEFVGSNCITICRDALTQLISGKYPTVPHFISQTPADARGQLDKFYNFASMQMFA